MQNFPTGRPRLESRKRPGATARDEILDAAAELFTTSGFAATSTRQIAESVGIRQASLYHHFRTKDDMLAELLSTTVVSSIEVAQSLRNWPESASVRLYALTLFDATLLWESEWNLGILYLMPEVRSPKFSEFHSQRLELRAEYQRLGAEVQAELSEGNHGGGIPGFAVDEDTPFRLVEALPNLRADGVEDAHQPQKTADLALYSLGWSGQWEELRGAARDVLSPTVTGEAPVILTRALGPESVQG